MGQQAPNPVRDERGAGLTGASPAVAMRGITKRFPGVLANDAVDFAAAAGEVHALLGENGAGKSTLSNILTGLYRPDEGEIRVYGEPVSFDVAERGDRRRDRHGAPALPPRPAVHRRREHHPRRAPRRGPQVPDQPRSDREARCRARRAVRPRRRSRARAIWQLSVGEQQRVEILKALYREARILILDEPTAVLTPQEADALFETLRTMAAEGRTVIFISHKLHEVKAVADQVTVLRGGRSVATVTAADATSRELAALMVGREVELAKRVERADPARRGAGARGRRAQRARRPRRGGGPGSVRSVCAKARSSASPASRATASASSPRRSPGCGRPPAACACQGQGAAARRPARGDPRRDRARSRGPARHRRRAVADDRGELGAEVVPRPARSRAARCSAGARSASGARQLIERYRVAAPGPHARARDLSGGNLQKLVLGREFSGEPKVLIAASPTRGLDVGAIETVHAYLRQAAGDGVGVLLISEDLDEILALSDRDRRHLRGPDHRRVRPRDGDGRGDRARDGRRRARDDQGRAPAQPAALALVRGAGRLGRASRSR